jgi:hypothetical protein
VHRRGVGRGATVGRGWPEEAVLDGPGCDGRLRHGARRSRGRA